MTPAAVVDLTRVGVRRRDEEPVRSATCSTRSPGDCARSTCATGRRGRERWPEVVDPVLAEHCRPEFIKSGVLVVSVPSGAFASE